MLNPTANPWQQIHDANPKFIGIDFGWRSQPSGLCCLAWQDGRLQVVELNRLDAIADILAWVDCHLPSEESGIIAVDAPTLIPNATGMRLCDRLTHRYFGRYHAGCYPANLGSPFAERTLKLGLSLEARGFQHAPVLQPKQLGRHQIEVFPHPAIVHLFGLNRILKYKKGRLVDRKSELSRLRHYILTILPDQIPALAVGDEVHFTLPDIPERGIELKVIEDQLDSLICAYVAAHWWYWGLERNLVLGDRSTGYIVVPSPVNKAS
jgi:predicted RNase H-like nuclease